MKKTRFSLPVIISMVSMIIIVIIASLNLKNSTRLNDNKSKLTLLKTAIKVPGLKSVIEKNLAAQAAQAQEQVQNISVLESARVYTEIELKEMTEEQFSNLLKDIQSRLPKLSDIKSLPAGALHRTPTIIIEAGRDLGLIKEILKIHESYEKSAVPFYKTCAKNNEGTTPVRALCLTNLVEIKKKKGQDLNMAEYPHQIIELAKMVTDI